MKVNKRLNRFIKNNIIIVERKRYRFYLVKRHSFPWNALFAIYLCSEHSRRYLY